MIMCSKCKKNMGATNTINDFWSNEVIRRRCCPDCGKVVFTVEKVVEQETETGLQKFIQQYAMGEVK